MTCVDESWDGRSGRGLRLSAGSLRVRRARVANPENGAEHDDDCGEGEDSPGKGIVARDGEIYWCGADIFGARELQVRKFFFLFLDLDTRVFFESWLRVGRDGTFLRHGGSRSWSTRRDGTSGIPDFMRVDLRLAQSDEVVVDGFFGVVAEMLGVGADESFIEDAAGKLLEVVFFDSLQHAGADLGDVGNVVERDAFSLARQAKFFAKLGHWIFGGEVDFAGVMTRTS